ncbi:MAG TPA: hypothetical protein VKO63_07580, partial [Chitinispirillaceae bacterium]|nr:hypothetical protein [Chitinispirillaceae bacterium]
GMYRNAFLSIAVMVLSVSAQTINLQGTVSNSSGKPISKAVVSLVTQKMKDTTSTDGKYSFVSTSVINPSFSLPQSNNISLKNNVLHFSLNTQSPLKVEIFDLKGNLLLQEVNSNATAGMYQFDISKISQTTKVMVIKAAIGSSEVSFRYMALKGGQYTLTPVNSTSSGSGSSYLTALAAAVDTISVTATGYQTKSVAITSLINAEQNISLDTNISGKEFPTANPAAKGPFAVAADKNVGPLAGTANDPVYGQQMRFNVYRPKDLKTSGYLHPILMWANGYKDNPEPNGKCVLDRNQNWCGQYLPILEHLASHGFVVVASLSTATGTEPYPTLTGMDWIIKQNEDPSSPYYHCLDTSKIGQYGHSFGGMSTCLTAADPRYKALMTICGTQTLKGVHTPMLFYCGGKDETVKCDGVRNTFLTVKDQPAMLINEAASDHGWWVYQGANGVSLSAAAAWFRVHLMNDTANRKYFYGSSCTFCSDSRVKVERNSLMTQ